MLGKWPRDVWCRVGARVLGEVTAGPDPEGAASPSAAPSVPPSLPGQSTGRDWVGGRPEEPAAPRVTIAKPFSLPGLFLRMTKRPRCGRGPLSSEHLAPVAPLLLLHVASNEPGEVPFPCLVHAFSFHVPLPI